MCTPMESTSFSNVLIAYIHTHSIKFYATEEVRLYRVNNYNSTCLVEYLLNRKMFQMKVVHFNIIYNLDQKQLLVKSSVVICF